MCPTRDSTVTHSPSVMPYLRASLGWIMTNGSGYILRWAGVFVQAEWKKE